MKSKDTSRIRSSEITPKTIWEQRRDFLRVAALAGLGVAAGCTPGESAGNGREPPERQSDAPPRRAIRATPNPDYRGEGLKLTSLEDITHYNNFYEFGTGKEDPARRARRFVTRPWSLRVEGECEKPGEIGIEEILSGFPQEERIYRFRCVEAWSMVIPWVGFPLGDLLKRFAPTSKARYVAFETLYDPNRMPGQKRRVLDWPYREGLRIDEAMHPLTLLATGLYGEELPNQNGAPLRLVVPWKYGFKSIKSIVAIRFTEKPPPCTWNRMAPEEYGFYANVNPEVDHPRWSQRYERVIGEGLFGGKHRTLPFNGYAEQVADLYSGMDLSLYF